MLRSNECPLGESLRGMPEANVAMQLMSLTNAFGECFTNVCDDYRMSIRIDC